MTPPRSHFPWRKIVIIAISAFVIGNSLFTLLLYVLGKPGLTAWTGYVAQATPSAVNDLLLGVFMMIVGLYTLRHE